MEREVVYRRGCGLGFTVFIVLLIIKLVGAATISWFWVFFPLWIGPAIIIGIFLIFVLLGIIGTVLGA